MKCCFGINRVYRNSYTRLANSANGNSTQTSFAISCSAESNSVCEPSTVSLAVKIKRLYHRIRLARFRKGIL